MNHSAIAIIIFAIKINLFFQVLLVTIFDKDGSS